MHLRYRLMPAVFIAGLFCYAGPARAEDALPKAEEILDKFVEATGGKAAYEKIHNEKATGTFEFVGKGVKGAMTNYRAEPNKMYMRIDLENIGAIEDGTDGETAWTLSVVQGPHIKQGEERAVSLREATLRAPLEWRKLYKNAETAAVEDVNGQACYKLVLTPNEGSPETQYVDKETNLPVKTEMTLKGPMGEIPVEATIGDYRKEGDLMMPHKTIQKAAGQEISILFDSVKFNVDIPKEKFDLPEEIQALLKKQ